MTLLADLGDLAMPLSPICPLYCPTAYYSIFVVKGYCLAGGDSDLGLLELYVDLIPAQEGGYQRIRIGMAISYLGF